MSEIAVCPECNNSLDIIRTTMETERVYPWASLIKDDLLIVEVSSTSTIDTTDHDAVAYCSECDYKINVELEW